MPAKISDIVWGESILSETIDPEWRKRVKTELGGACPELMMIVAPSGWLRMSCLKWPRYKPQEFPQRLADIATLVTAQENACRYCYGIARSQMKLFGYSESLINRIEKGLHLAELDEKERTFIQFCRNLARSNPRPPKSDRDKLIQLGYSETAVAEMAFYIAAHCFINRVATFLASPLFYRLENMSVSFVGKIMRPIIAKKMRRTFWNDPSPVHIDSPNYAGVVGMLDGLPAASLLHNAMIGSFESEVLSKELKILMFAVVAKAMGCPFCLAEAEKLAYDCGIDGLEFNSALSSLTSNRLNEQESKILLWTRETIHFETGDIQSRVRILSNDLDDHMLLEAIGVAGLANSVVRLAVLLG